MKINIIAILRSIVVILLVQLMMKTTVIAQQNNSLYFMDGIPQSNQLNPATQPRYGVYIGLPALSSIEINAGNSAVGFSDVLISNLIQDSLVFPLYNKSTRDNFLSKFSKNNFVYSDFKIDWLSFGFRINDSYISFSVGDKVEAYGNLPYGLVDLGVNFNQTQVPSASGASKTFDFSKLGVNATWYREYALGFSQQVNDQIFFGVRGKLLFGKANLTSRNSNISMNTSLDSWKVQSVIEVNSSVPKMNVYYSSDNKPDSVKFDDVKGNDAYNIAMNKANLGAALDLGIIYKLAPNFSVSASVIDLGFIRWKSNVNNVIMSGSYPFNGIPINLSNDVNMGSAFVDTLKKAFTYTHDKDAYITTLSGKVYLGAYFQPVKWIGLGALSRSQMLYSRINQQFTFSLNLFPANCFNFTLSYTIADKMYDNLGLAVCHKIGPFQFYFMSERIPLYWDKIKSQGTGTIPVPYDAKSINFHMGMNLVFGSERNKKLKKDKPLVEI